MDFRLTAEQDAFRQEVRGWIAAEFGTDLRRPPYSSVEAKKLTREVNTKLAKKGWLAMHWPREYGGAGATHWEQLIFGEEMGYVGIPFGGIGISIAGPTIIVYGTEEQKQRYLQPITAGEEVWCQGFSEPGSGSDLASLQTRAVRNGDTYTVNGQKIWTTSGHYADMMVLLARTDPAAPKHKGISFFLVDMKTPGIKVRPLIDITGGHTVNEVFFDDVQLPAESLLGEENRGWYQATTTLDIERSSVGQTAGLRRSLDELVAYVRERGVKPGLRNRLADLAVSIATARTLSYKVVSMQSRGLVPNQEASTVKLYVSELMQHVAQTGYQVLGQYGQLQPGSHLARLDGHFGEDVLSTVMITIAGGTSEVQRNIIATRGLGLPRV